MMISDERNEMCMRIDHDDVNDGIELDCAGLFLFVERAQVVSGPRNSCKDQISLIAVDLVSRDLK
jgi:uncharacterized protein Smg (DUF494 family)